MIRKLVAVAVCGMLLAGQAFPDNASRNWEGRNDNGKQGKKPEAEGRVSQVGEMEKLSRSERLKKMKEEADTSNADSRR